MHICGGFASQLMKFIIGHNISIHLKTDYAIEIADYYNGYFRPYSLSYFDLPQVRIIDNNNLKNIEKQLFFINCNEDMYTMLKDGDIRNYYIPIENAFYSEFLLNNNYLDVNVNLNILKNLELKERSHFVDTFDKNIKNKFSVAVHIRRGDFVTLGIDNSIEYYKKAIGYVIKKYPNAYFYFFSNDLQYVYENFGTNERFYYISSNNGYYGDVIDFICMAKCNLRILTSESGYGYLANYLSVAKYNGIGAIQNDFHKYRKYDHVTYLSEDELNDCYNIFNNTFSKIITYDANIDLKNVNNDEIDEQLVNLKIFSNKVFEKYIVKRIENYYKTIDLENLRGCLETYKGNSIKDDEMMNMWKQIYSYIGNFKEDKINFVKNIKYKTSWYLNGYDRLCNIANRLGKDYNMMSKEVNHEIVAHDMDGNDYCYRWLPYDQESSAVKIILPNEKNVLSILKNYLNKLQYKVYRIYNKFMKKRNILLENINSNSISPDSIYKVADIDAYKLISNGSSSKRR